MVHDDWDSDFPPTAHPVREALTMGFFVLLIAALLVWAGKILIALF